MKIIGIIQARTGSTRLPGKMLLPLGDLFIIDWIITRLLKVDNFHSLFLATTCSEKDKILINHAKKHNIDYYAGDEHNVFSRFKAISEYANPDAIVRICGDNPFIAPEVVNDLIDHFLKSHCEYSCNHQDRLGSGYADGFGAEIFRIEILDKILKSKLNENHLEHVTSFIWENQKDFKISLPKAPKELRYPNLKFDLDTEEDYKFLINIVDKGVNISHSAEEIIKRHNSFNNINL